MTPEHQAALTQEINRAHALAQEGRTGLAVKSFDLARGMARDWADPAALARAISTEKTNLGRERLAYADRVATHSTQAGRKQLLILGDSLGLPRPDAMATPQKGAEITYPWRLGNAGFRVAQVCQRYFTTADALRVLDETPALAECDAAVIHLGLNDCANRMFMEDERLALGLLPEALRTRIVGFAQTYRRQILTQLPSRHYVTVEDYSANLDKLATRLRQGGARQLVLTTTILPPSRAWPSTPGVNANFGRYNQALMEVAWRTGATLFDLDRLIYEAGFAAVLNPDGMHLSAEGHALFANSVERFLN